MNVTWAAPDLEDRVAARLAALEAERVVERLWARDHTLWKPGPEEIADRLGWLTIAEEMAQEVSRLRAFAGQVRTEGFRQVILMGMGGSSLAAEVIAGVIGRQKDTLDLVVLDSTDPAEVTAAEHRAERAGGRVLFIAASKSGTTLETRCQLDYMWDAFPGGDGFVAITDPGTELEHLARERGFREVFLNPEDIGGRFSALSYFGLVPAALLGADIDELLGSAMNAAEACRRPAAANPGVRLGVMLGEAALAGRDKLMLALPPTMNALEPWLEQLIAESTGKEGKGILPVVGDPGSFRAAEDRLWVGASGDPQLSRWSGPAVFLDDLVPAQLGAQFFLWEFATAVAGVVLGVNPFDQPNVQEAKEAAQRFLEGSPRPDTANAGADEVLASIRPGDYLALLAWMQRSPEHEGELQRMRRRLGERFGVPTTLGFGPRYLHSTGQYHKGGPNSGVFLQVLAEDQRDPAIPDRGYTFGNLKRAQADGDLASLAAKGRRIARVSPDELGRLADGGRAPRSWFRRLLGRQGPSAPPPDPSPGPKSPVKWSAASEQGLARKRNVDAYAVAFEDGRSVFAVADGTGSMPLAGVASRAAADGTARLLSAGDMADIGELITGELREAVSSALDGRYTEGATTVVAAVLTDAAATVVSVGDSEAIAVWEPGRVELLNELDNSEENPNVLVSWVDGHHRHQPHVITLDTRPMYLCLVTDGVTRALTYDEIGRIVVGAGTEAAAAALVRAAQEGGSGDDVTALVIDTGGSG